ncbi:MAG TPA: DUF2061 domain-containing protein [Chitinophagaceae bacterium]|nr:DUF2061 domain-containing protein [Chitinophagaceae bacterium]
MVIDQVYSAVKSGKESKDNSEKHSRSMVKAISWRTVGTLDTILLSWLIAGDWTIAISIGSVELLTKTSLYYFHERIWNNIKWGK